MDNIVLAPYSSDGNVRTRPLYRYDYGQILKITGVELPQTYTVHFSNDRAGYSITQIGNEDGVPIPDEYLLSGKPIYAWLYLHTGADDGETTLHIVIPVINRATPTNAHPTAVQQDAIDTAIAALNAAVADIDEKADKTDTVLDTTLSIGRKANTTSGTNSVALGEDVEASGKDSHAEGWSTTASGNYSHSEGAFTTASGLMAHSEGGYTTASGLSSHAEGVGTISNHSSQHVFGEYNVADPSENAASVRGTYIEIVGKGNDDNTRSNARTLDWNGNEVLHGSLTVGNNLTVANTVTVKNVTVKNVTINNNTLNYPYRLSFNQCDSLELVRWGEDEEIGWEDSVVISMQDFKGLLEMLAYYQSITPFTAQEISLIRALIGSNPDPGVEEPVPEEPAVEEPAIEEP